MKDFGYDISDFMDIDPIFGTLDDFKDLIAAVHSRGKLGSSLLFSIFSMLKINIRPIDIRIETGYGSGTKPF